MLFAGIPQVLRPLSEVCEGDKLVLGLIAVGFLYWTDTLGP